MPLGAIETHLQPAKRPQMATITALLTQALILHKLITIEPLTHKKLLEEFISA